MLQYIQLEPYMDVCLQELFCLVKEEQLCLEAILLLLSLLLPSVCRRFSLLRNLPLPPLPLHKTGKLDRLSDSECRGPLLEHTLLLQHSQSGIPVWATLALQTASLHTGYGTCESQRWSPAVLTCPKYKQLSHDQDPHHDSLLKLHLSDSGAQLAVSLFSLQELLIGACLFPVMRQRYQQTTLIHVCTRGPLCWHCCACPVVCQATVYLSSFLLLGSEAAELLTRAALLSCSFLGRLYALLRSSAGVSKCRWGLKEGASSPSRNTVCLLCCGAPMKCNDLRKRSTFCKGSLPPEHMHSLCSDKDRQDRALVFGTLTW